MLSSLFFFFEMVCFVVSPYIACFVGLHFGRYCHFTSVFSIWIMACCRALQGEKYFFAFKSYLLFIMNIFSGYVDFKSCRKFLIIWILEAVIDWLRLANMIYNATLTAIGSKVAFMSSKRYFSLFILDWNSKWG